MASAHFGTPEGIRIPDLPLRRRTLYPTELLAHILEYCTEKQHPCQPKTKFYPQANFSRNHGSSFCILDFCCGKGEEECARTMRSMPTSMTGSTAMLRADQAKDDENRASLPGFLIYCHFLLYRKAEIGYNKPKCPN